MSEADNDTALVLVQLFDAPIEAVFDAWTGREEWQAWLGPQGVQCEVSQLDARVDGVYRLTMHLKGGETIPVAGVFKTVDRPRSLAFTWGFDGDVRRQTLVSLSFRSLGPGKTELTLRQEGLGTKANRDSHGSGWRGALEKLAAHLAAAPNLSHRRISK